MAIGLITAGVAAVSGLVNSIYQHDQNIKKQQAKDRENDRRKKLFDEGTGRLDQSRERKRTALQDWMTSSRSELKGLFGDIRDEARGATGRLGTLGGTPEQRLVEPQINRLTSQFNTQAQDRFLGIESEHEQGMLGLTSQFNQQFDVGEFEDDTFGDFFGGFSGGFNLGSDVEDFYNENFGSGSQPDAFTTPGEVD